MSDKNAGKTRPDGMPVGTPFSSEYQPEHNGRPKGPSLGTLIKRYLDGDEKLPEAIEATIRAAVGADKKAGEAMIIAGMLQALQGNEAWAKLLWSYSDGKPTDNLAVTGKDGGPIAMTISWQEPSEK